MFCWDLVETFLLTSFFLAAYNRGPVHLQDWFIFAFNNSSYKQCDSA